MKIPSKIRIGGVDYTIEYTDELNDGSRVLCGQIDYLHETIQIHNGHGHQQQCITLLHEVLHGIQNHIGVDLGDKSEDIIDMFARGMYQVLQDNGRQLFDIVEPKKTKSKN